MSNPLALDLFKRGIEIAVQAIVKCDQELYENEKSLEFIRDELSSTRFELKLARKRRFPNFNRAMKDEEEEIQEHLQFLQSAYDQYCLEKKDFKEMRRELITRRSEFLHKILVLTATLGAGSVAQ